MEDGEYTFVLRNPRRLMYPVKISAGRQEVFSLSNDIFENIQRNLQRMRVNWAAYALDDELDTGDNLHVFE